jgi:hypothetical protein
VRLCTVSRLIGNACGLFWNAWGLCWTALFQGRLAPWESAVRSIQEALPCLERVWASLWHCQFFLAACPPVAGSRLHPPGSRLGAARQPPSSRQGSARAQQQPCLPSLMLPLGSKAAWPGPDPARRRQTPAKAKTSSPALKSPSKWAI